MGDPNMQMPPVTAGAVSDEDKMWALCAHLSGLAGISLIGPLIIWLIKKDESPFIDDQAKEALNFQLSILVAALALTVTCVGVFLLPVVAVGGLVYAIIGGMASYRGEYYRYPYTFRMIN